VAEIVDASAALGVRIWVAGERLSLGLAGNG
jgi:hypothetical protein